MKKFDLQTAILNSILSICMGVCVAGCISTAFSLEGPDWPVLTACLFWAAIICWIFPLKRGWIAIPAGLVLWAILLRIGNTGHQFGRLLYELFYVYSRAYGIQVPSVLSQFKNPDVSLALSVISGSVTMLCGISLGRLRSGTLAIAACILPILPCFVVTDTVPNEVFLLLLMVCISLILLTQSTRRRYGARQVNQLTCLLLIPVLLAGTCLFWLNPRQEYHKQPENLLTDELLSQWFPQWTVTGPDLQIPISLGEVYLQAVGPKTERDALAMEVETELTGILYLRGKSYAYYNGLSWSAPQLERDMLKITHDAYLESPNGLRQGATVTIRTAKPENLLYSAYYTPAWIYLWGGTFHNPDLEREYSMDVQPLRSDWKRLYRKVNPGLTLADAKKHPDRPTDYSELPQNTLTEAKKLLSEAQITGHMHVLTAVDAIVDYVSNSASYSLDTGFMPVGQKDFALWFLRESDTGYCVHFASAAAVLLRAAGIPARYVEGYVTRVGSDGTARVTEDQAHAWVECWLPELGWIALEPTPAAGWVPDVEQPKPTEPTTEPTKPTTQPTRPTTRPTEPTTQPTEPTEPTTDPTEPTTEPTKPTTGPTKPTTGPTEPTTEPTKPTTQPTWPTTGATEPSQSATHPTQTESATQPSVPATTAPGIDPPVKPAVDYTWLWAWLQGLVLAVLIVGTLLGQWRLRMAVRTAWLTAGSTNTQALRRWRFTRLLARLRRQEAPAALKELAQKARFSQHTISREELAAFEGYFTRSVDHLDSRSWPLRLLYRLVLAIY